MDNNENIEILEESADNQDELVLDEDIELDKDMNTKVTEEYDASQIQVLEGLEAAIFGQRSGLCGSGRFHDKSCGQHRRRHRSGL